MADLSEREQQILERVIQYYILNASPVGSRTISKQMTYELSPASIRNIMSDLEEMGYISHMHTSSGRIPTDKGYRYFVNELMRYTPLTADDELSLLPMAEHLRSLEMEEILQESVRILGGISNQLAIISEPHLGTGILERLELVRVSSQKLMIILSISSGIFKTIILEMHSDAQTHGLERVSELLNTRLAGLTLREIRETFRERVQDAASEETGIIRLFIQETDRVFQDQRTNEKVHIDGLQNILQQPEFEKPERLREIIELVDNHSFIVHFLSSINETDAVTIKIGREFDEGRYTDYSIIAAPYRFGSTSGTISIVGPRRMNYPRMVTVIDSLARLLSR